MINKIIKLIFITVALFFLIEFFAADKVFAVEEKIWVDTSHWEIETSFVTDGYWKSDINKRWVDTSYIENSGYWSQGSYSVWADTSHWQNSGYWTTEDYSIWINSGHSIIKTYNLYINSGYTSYNWITSGYWTTYAYIVWISSGYFREEKYGYWKIIEEYGWSINRQYPVIGSAGHAQWVTYSLYRWVDTSHYETRYSSRWTDTSHWESTYHNTSHWEQRQSTEWIDTSHYEKRQRSVWKGASTYINEGHWETRSGSHWVNTSYVVSQGNWESYTTNTWVDTSFNETKKVWINSGYFADPMHGTVIVEKYPKYIFTRWHKDSIGEEASMSLEISWKVDNSLINTEEDKRKISRVYVYEDVVRYDNKGIEKVIIYESNIASLEEGSIDAKVKFDYAGNEESLLHVYLYAENGEAGHIFFINPVNGFRSINLEPGGTGTNPDLWLGGIIYEVFEF
ncbi:MAG: hypothetical protein ACYCXK_09585 [Candidatus Humimicrobiaceae bacterium]